MKKFYILFVLLFSICNLFAQNEYFFNYDDGGKSITRYTTVAQIPGSIDLENTDIEFKSVESDTSINNLVKIYPNPTTSSINIDIKNIDLHTVTIEVYTLSGSKILTQQYYDSLMWINLDSLIPDTYLLVVTIDNIQKISRKIIKQ